MLDESIIELKNVTFTYPETKTPAVKDLNLKIKKGSWTTILGRNGSGKSTVTRLINGLLVPDDSANSKIIVDGITLNEDSVWNIRDRVGIVFQNPDNQFVGATVADDVAFGLENRDVPRDKMLKIVPEAIKSVGMSDYINSEPSSLSGGQKQRVAIAGILAVHPKIIILDESTSMLDPEGRQTILDIILKMKKKDDLTILSITHDIDEAEIADQVVILNDGVLLDQGKPNEIFNKVDQLREIGLDVPFAFKLKQELLSVGISIPANVNSKEKLVKFLCQLNSKM